MKFTYFNATLIGFVLSACCLMPKAYAGIIKSTTNTNVTQRYCPSVTADFNAYKANWGQVIIDYYGSFLPGAPTTIAEISPEAACIFNTQWETFFDGANPGTVVSLQDIQNNINRSYIENAVGDIWLEAVLDNTQLALPEAHFVVTSEVSERNSANLFSAQSYLWQGDTTTLEFSAFFDFSMSVGAWGTGQDSLYGLHIGASKDLTLSASNLFPDSWGQELASATYQSTSDSLIINEDVNYRNLTVTFEVNKGDKFQLWGLSQAFALNGGWIDSANTMKTQLSVEGLNLADSNAVFASSLSVDVPAPSTLTILTIAMFGLVLRRTKKHF